MIIFKYTKYAILPMSLLLTQSASATCVAGIPDANQVLMDTLNEPATLAWVNELMDGGEGWTSSRGNGSLTATHLEFSKLFLGAFLISNGVVSEELQVSQNASGAWEYTPGQIYLNPAFHRSGDEWAPLISDNDWTVCDSLSPTDGSFSCVKERFRNWPAPKQYRWFGYPNDTAIFDATTDLDIMPGVHDPDTTESLIESWAFQKKRELQYFCPLFEDDQGNFDQMVLPRVILNLVVNSWHLHLDRRPKADPQRKAFITSPKHSSRREAIARDDSDDGLSIFQVAQEAMCDLAVAPQSWVPVMVQEVMGEGFRDEARAERYNNTKNGNVGFTCTSMRDPLVQMTPTSPADCGSLSCNDVSDCPGGYNDCFHSCCVLLR